MIHGFENETARLTKEELGMAQYVASRLSNNIGKANAAKSKQIINALGKQGLKLTGPRLRKIINYIRMNHMTNGILVASSKGYYIENNKKEIEKYIKGLRDRSAAIKAVADKLSSLYIIMVN